MSVQCMLKTGSMVPPMLKVWSNEVGMEGSETLGAVITDCPMDRVQGHSLGWLISEMTDGLLSFGVSLGEGVQ